MVKTLSNSIHPPPHLETDKMHSGPNIPPCLSASRPVIGGRPHLSLLQPIGPGEELLVWYTVEDNPEITAALEEERASSLNRKNSPRAKRGEALLTSQR